MTLWFCQRDGRTKKIIHRNIDEEPAPTVCAKGMGDSLASKYWIEDDSVVDVHTDRPFSFAAASGREQESCTGQSWHAGMNTLWPEQHRIEDDGMGAPMIDVGKPPYCVPNMAEIAAMPWNGLNVVSTFAGCGGSSLGYRMAGYRVLWANEFVPRAAACYRANCMPGTIVDTRDIKQVTPEEVLAAIGMRKEELDLLDGSPPCQAFSTAGQRHRGWGKDKVYEHGARQRNEDLFPEFARLLRGIMPRAFVAENVSGLVKGVAKGYFLEILAELKSCGYRVEARLLDAQWLGVPQSRGRVIFVGVREDLNMQPAFPSPLPYRYSVRDACPWISRVDHDTHGPQWSRGNVTDKSVPAILAQSGCHFKITEKSKQRKFTIAELKRICAFPDDFELMGSYAQQWERLGNSVPPLMMRAIAMAIRDHVLKKNEPPMKAARIKRSGKKISELSSSP